MDVLMLNKDSGEHVIIDWKTSRRIDKNSFKGKKGIKRIVFTDISRDGMLTGPNLEHLRD